MVQWKVNSCWNLKYQIIWKLFAMESFLDHGFFTLGLKAHGPWNLRTIKTRIDGHPFQFERFWVGHDYQI